MWKVIDTEVGARPRNHRPKTSAPGQQRPLQLAGAQVDGGKSRRDGGPQGSNTQLTSTAAMKVPVGISYPQSQMDKGVRMKKSAEGETIEDNGVELSAMCESVRTLRAQSITTTSGRQTS